MSARIVQAVKLSCNYPRCGRTEIVVVEDEFTEEVGPMLDQDAIDAARDMRARVITGTGWQYDAYGTRGDYCPDHDTI